MAAELNPDPGPAPAPGNMAELCERFAAVEQLLGEMAGEFRGLLDDFRPLLDRYRSTNGGTVGLLRARRGRGREG